MDALRQFAISNGYRASERDAFLFHRLFIGVVRQFGRSHEAFLLGLFKVLSHTPLMNDVGAGIGLFLRGKVPLVRVLVRQFPQPSFPGGNNGDLGHGKKPVGDQQHTDRQDCGGS